MSVTEMLGISVGTVAHLTIIPHLFESNYLTSVFVVLYIWGYDNLKDPTKGTKVVVTDGDFIDLEGNIHCFILWLSSCNLKSNIIYYIPYMYHTLATKHSKKHATKLHLLLCSRKMWITCTILVKQLQNCYKACCSPKEVFIDQKKFQETG